MIEALFGILSPEGILVAHVGEAPSLVDSYSDSRLKYVLVQRLLDVGFHSVKDYEEVGIRRVLEFLIFVR
jgi:hypothetical protein